MAARQQVGIDRAEWEIVQRVQTTLGSDDRDEIEGMEMCKE